MNLRTLTLRSCWLLLLWGWAAAAAAAEPALPTFNADYSLQRNGITLGTSTRSLRPAKTGHYVYESLTYASGVISWFVKDRIEERSIVTLHNGQVRPSEYVYHRHGGSKTRRVKLAFNWERGIVTNVIDGDPWRMEIPPDTHDKLDYQLAIMLDLQNGKKELRYNIADGGTLKTYAFAILGEEQIDTPLGRLKTVKIRRIDDKRNTTVWCAPALSYLPVRLDQQETDGSNLSMHLQSLQGLAPRPSPTAAPAQR